MKKIIVSIGLLAGACSLKAQTTLEQARKMIDYQRYATAQEQLQQLSNSNPSDENIRYWQGQVLLLQKDPKKALAFYQKASASSTSPLLKAGLAQAYFASGMKAPAQQVLSAMDTAAEHQSAAANASALARAFTEAKDYTRSMRLAKKAILLDPLNARYLVQAGNIALRNRDGSAAYSLFTNATRIDSNYAPGYFSLAKIFISQKNTDLYMPLLKKTIAKDSLFSPAWYEMYRHAYYNDKENAKRYYTKFLDLSDKTDQQEIQLLVLDYNSKKYAKVIERAAKLFADEDNQVPAEVYRYLAFSYYKTNKTDSAYQDMVQYMQTQDSGKISAYDHYLMAQLAVRQNPKDSVALSYITDAYERDTALANKKFYAMSLVNHYVTSGDKYAATVWREKLLPLKGVNKVDMYRIGVAWYEFNELDKAEKLFIQFNNLYPEEYKGLFMHAGIKAKIDSNTATGIAVPYFEDFVQKVAGNTSVEYKPMLQQSYNYLGAYYLGKKDYDKSLEYYQALLKLQPGSAELKKTVAGLKKYMRDMNEYKNQAKNNKAKKESETENR